MSAPVPTRVLRSCRSCQNSQTWTKGGGRSFCSRFARISLPRAGDMVADMASSEGEGRLFTWRTGLVAMMEIFCAIFFERKRMSCACPMVMGYFQLGNYYSKIS